MIKEISTTIDTHHKYQIPFKEFWDVVKDSKVLSKNIFYTSVYQNDYNSFRVDLESSRLDLYVKQFKLKGTIISVWSKTLPKSFNTEREEVIEITTQEDKVIKNEQDEKQKK